MGEERSGSAKDVGWAAKRADRRVACECQRQSQIRMLVCAVLVLVLCSRLGFVALPSFGTVKCRGCMCSSNDQDLRDRVDQALANPRQHDPSRLGPGWA